MLTAMTLLMVLFLVCLAATLGRAGMRIIAALALAAMLVGVVIPLMALRGVQPLTVAVPAGALAIIGGTLLIGGWNRKSLAAALGAGAALLLATILPLALAAPVQLTGLDQHFGPRYHLEVKLWYDPAYGRVNFQGLHLAVIILASIGAIMDMAMVIASSVHQAAASTRRSSFPTLLQMGFRAGRSVLGPMLITMLLIFFGAELAPTVARATLPGSGWDSFRLLNYESIASHVLETATAALGLLCGIPFTALFAAWLLGARGTKEKQPADKTASSRSTRGGTCLSIGVRAAGVLAVLVSALAVERGYIASYEAARVVADRTRGVREQEAMARVLSVQPPVARPLDRNVPHNPVRGLVADRLFPCAAEVLSGDSRGRLVTFVNRVRSRPYVNLILRPGALVLLTLTTRDGQILAATAYPLRMRWRPMLWGMAVIMALVIAGLGRYGLRALLLTSCVAATFGLVAVPLLAKGFPPAGVVLVSFALLVLAMLLFWEANWRSTLLASAGTLVGLIIGGAVAFAATRLMGITGAASATNRLLLQRPEFAAIDFAQLLAAGMTLMVMSAALDIAAGVVAGLTEFRRANPGASAPEILRAGLRLNRDVAGMMVLTLLLAWLALRLPILLLMHRSQEAFGPQWVECYAMEVIRFTSGAVALLFAGPFAAMLFSVASRARCLSAPGVRRVPSAERWLMLLGSVLVTLLGALWIAQTHRPHLERRLDLSLLQRESSSDRLHALAAEKARGADWDTCMVLLWRARELDPESPIIRRDLAYAYLARQWPELARDAIHSALPALQNDARAHYICGVLAWWEGNVEAARQELQRALELDPNLDDAADALARLP